MPDEVQPDEPAARLYAAAAEALPAWLRRATTDACVRGGVDPAVLSADLDEVAEQSARVALDRLRTLLATDVDEQRTTPLSICRAATAAPTELLLRHRVPTPASSADRDGADPYGLEPASWIDVHPALHEPGLAWGAWKAMTVLRRRRDDGLR